MKENLYILGFPRSMSTVTYKIVAISLKADYLGVDGGEFLNRDRVMTPLTALHKDYVQESTLFWTNKRKEDIMNLLDDLHTFQKKWVIKDVVFPHIVSEFVNKNMANTIIMDKEIPLTAYSLIKNGWFYPTRILYDEEPKGIDRVKALLKSLAYMQSKYFEPLKKHENVKTITPDEIMTEPEKIFDILEELGYEPNRFKYINKELEEKYKQVQEYKQTQMYKDIEKTWKGIKNE